LDIRGQHATSAPPKPPNYSFALKIEVAGFVETSLLLFQLKEFVLRIFIAL
jgi:hypothetical protein